MLDRYLKMFDTRNVLWCSWIHLTQSVLTKMPNPKCRRIRILSTWSQIRLRIRVVSFGLLTGRTPCCTCGQCRILSTERLHFDSKVTMSVCETCISVIRPYLEKIKVLSSARLLAAGVLVRSKVVDEDERRRVGIRQNQVEQDDDDDEWDWDMILWACCTTLWPEKGWT